MGIPDALLVDRSSVPPQLVCAVCTNVVLEPVETPCHHLFCLDCLRQSFAAGMSCCPLDRKAFSLSLAKPIKEVNPILFQIWSDIRVRCQHCFTAECSWTGSTADLNAHSSRCLRPNRVDQAQHSVALERIKKLESEVQAMQRTITGLRNEITDANNTISNLRRQLAESSVVVDRNYAYNRDNIEDLTKLIVMHFRGPPASVNVNRIFNCIRNILQDYADLYREYEDGWTDDEPRYEREQCRMLLAVANASCWFTYRQLARFNEFENIVF